MAPEALDLGPELPPLRRAAHRDEDLIDLKRLRQVIVSAELHRLDRRGRVAVSRHDDRRNLRSDRLEPPQRFDAVEAGHDAIEEHDRGLFGHDAVKRGLAVSGGDRVESIGGQDLGQGGSRVVIVIDNEDRRPGDFTARSGSRLVVDRVYSIRFAAPDQRWRVHARQRAVRSGRPHVLRKGTGSIEERPIAITMAGTPTDT